MESTQVARISAMPGTQLSAISHDQGTFSAAAGKVRNSHRENPQASSLCDAEAVKWISQGWKLGEGKRETALSFGQGTFKRHHQLASTVFSVFN